MKLMRPGLGPAAELPAFSPASRRHGGCSSPLGAVHVIGGNRRAALPESRGPRRTAYTKAVGRKPLCGSPPTARRSSEIARVPR